MCSRYYAEWRVLTNEARIYARGSWEELKNWFHSSHPFSRCSYVHNGNLSCPPGIIHQHFSQSVREYHFLVHSYSHSCFYSLFITRVLHVPIARNQQLKKETRAYRIPVKIDSFHYAEAGRIKPTRYFFSRINESTTVEHRIMIIESVPGDYNRIPQETYSPFDAFQVICFTIRRSFLKNSQCARERRLFRPLYILLESCVRVSTICKSLVRSAISEEVR